ncbi:alanine racemase [Aquimarina sp. ERC-38]|uniref:alanine racemase n=1 Tax=Aquimarina sp. ERC-38 TaxID=2949996 RepID=UPI0022465D7C|nr:alanine racemase [Aquimarina sp. ERC-38]UZO81742.1 alanine racemase [Aquimarina sp. ERC-38]
MTNMYHETVLEIHLPHLTHNFKYLKSKISAETKFMAVVKAAGYGSEAAPVAKHLQSLGVDYFAVAYTSEGVELVQKGITTPILVLHPQPTHFKELVTHRLIPSLYNLYVLKEFIQFCTSEGITQYPVHLKFNTGLNRIGFSMDDIDACYGLIRNTKAVIVEGILSHLAASEDLKEKEFTLGQIKSFQTIVSKAPSLFGTIPLVHQSNTSGILNYPEAHFTMVRSGIGLYGFGNDVKFDKNLKPVTSLKSVITQINTIKKGESVGYNRAFVANKKTISATIALGHADGIGRIFGNQKGFVWIHGKKAPILGNVCMDMLMVDVTAILCSVGDEVIIFNAHHTAASVAEISGTISYELLTAISPRVKRKIINR